MVLTGWALDRRPNRPLSAHSARTRRFGEYAEGQNARGAELDCGHCDRPGRSRRRIAAKIALRYQRALETNPQQPEALVGMSLVALSSRQTEAAVKMASAAVAAAPKMGAAWVVLGQALKAAERVEEAERAYAEAIRMDGMDVLARLGTGRAEDCDWAGRRGDAGVRAGAQAAACHGGGASGIGECAGADAAE